MVAGTIPIKTPDGQAELSTRQRRLGQRHRTVLLLVDGRRSAAEVRSMALQAGVPEACFDELLAMGLIMMPEPTFSLLVEAPIEADVLHVDLPLNSTEPDAAESILPPSRSLYPSVSTDSTLGDSLVAEAWLAREAAAAAGPGDPAVAEARSVLLRAVRAEAPLAGSLTLMRLRRAQSRDELVGLLGEVEARITKPHRTLAASQTMRRVRQLLGLPLDSALTPA